MGKTNLQNLSSISQKNQKEVSKIIDFQKVREQKLIEKRKNAERVLLKSLISVQSIVNQNTKMEVEIVDLSEEGCSLKVQTPKKDADDLKIKDSHLLIRMYFSRNNYLEIKAEIINSSLLLEDRGQSIRYGCKVDRTYKSYAAYQAFVHFLKIFSEHSQQAG